jgi:hypothetical protein
MGPSRSRPSARKNRDGSFSAKFFGGQQQLRTAATPERLVFSLVFFHDDRWLAFIDVPREALDNATAGMTPTNGSITPTLRLSNTQVLCGATDLQPYRDWWGYWPDLRRT